MTGLSDVSVGPSSGFNIELIKAVVLMGNGYGVTILLDKEVIAFASKLAAGLGESSH